VKQVDSLKQVSDQFSRLQERKTSFVYVNTMARNDILHGADVHRGDETYADSISARPIQQAGEKYRWHLRLLVVFSVPDFPEVRRPWKDSICLYLSVGDGMSSSSHWRKEMKGVEFHLERRSLTLHRTATIYFDT
jgi:hypothetical protein